jgi:hypothetical protein
MVEVIEGYRLPVGMSIGMWVAAAVEEMTSHLALGSMVLRSPPLKVGRIGVDATVAIGGKSRVVAVCRARQSVSVLEVG